MMIVMLLLGTMTTPAWAYKVTYHILALPMDHAKGTANTDETYDGWRTEAIKVEVANASNIKLEEHFKSPLAKNFTYYPASVIKKDDTARKIYQYRTNNKYKLFKAPLAPYIKVTVSAHSVTNEEVSNATAWGSAGAYQKTATGIDDMETQVAALDDGTYYFSFNDVCLHEEDPIPSNDYHVYVTYEYDADNTIAKLDGSEAYSIMMNDQFLAYNRGRNNRLAVIPNEYVSAEQLASEEFVYVDVSKVNTLKDKTYWQSSDNKNPAEVTKSKFHFLFKYIGEDPYNITIVSAYNSDEATYYIEKHGSETNFVKKLYRESHLFAKTKDNASDEMLIASDVNIRYTQTDWNNPSSEVTYDDAATYKGYYHGLVNTEIIWNSFALVKAVNKNGDVVPGKLVYMGTRTTQSNGELKVPGTNFYYLGYDNPATIKIKSYARQDAPTIDYNMYEIRTIHFKVKTPFGNIVTDSIKMSEYTMGLKDIALTDIPDDLRRKYCSFKSEFYKDAAHTQPVTSYSELTEPYDIYVDYTATLPFKAVNPSTGAQDTTWYELTDEGSTEANGKKIKYDGTANFKNNGATGSCDKTTEFAFVGDPYELRVLYRDATETAKADRYVGGTTNLDVSATASEHYRWEIPYDNAPNFLLRKMNNTGHWYWPTDQLSQSFSYATKAHAYSVPSGNAQTLTFTITNLTYSEGHYIKVTKGSTPGDAQVISTAPALADGKGSVREDGTATLTVSIAANSESDKVFTLTIQEYNGSNDAVIGTPMVITVTQSAAAYGGQYITYSTTNATRIKLLELPKRTYTYKIVDKAGNIAVQATATQPIYASLSLASLPANIISPYLLYETLTFYATFNSGSGAGTGTSRTHLDNQITQTPDEDATIYVKYTTTHLNDQPIKLSEDQEFNVKLNGQYIYYDKTSHEILTATEIPGDADAKRYYLWKLRNRDPYAMLVDNVGARVDLRVENIDEDVTVYDDNGGTSTQSREKGAWVNLKSSVGNAVGLELQTDRSLAQHFVAKSSLNRGVYEVMVATGETVDASTTYYNMGRPAAENTVKIYDNENYAHGSNALAFILDQSIVYTYHLIDKAKHLLLTIDTKSADLVLPAEYQSPLVSTYKFYAPNNISIDNKGTASTSDDEYTPINAGTMIDNLAAVYTKESSNESAWSAADVRHQKTAKDETDVDMQARQLKLTGDFYFKTTASAYYHVNVTKAFHDTIYVTYNVNDRVKFNDAGSPYMLRFLDVDAIPMYYMEDGSDKLTTMQIKPIYPYCNGDGSLNIYGAAMQEEQFNGGSSTRPRWTWFFESDGDDPYHVKIHSSNTISYNGVGHPTYLETKAVHFNQDETDVKHIVTCGSLPGIASTNPTEYMILGTDGHFKLLTTYPINETVVDGSADKDKRQYVTSFEQYWKTYNMIKQCVLGIDVKNDPYYKDAFSNDEKTWVVPEELRATLNTKLDEKGIGSGNWHSYEAIASAVRWNGYNDKGKANTKLVEKIEHWYQTFTMGDGTFDIESADIPPVLVLLDLHGWEIMRLPLGYNSSAALAALRAYDSPLVDKYYFYSNATKATGCHRYTLRMQNGAERDQIKVNGKHYTSESLGELPPETATGVKSNGAFNDQFVTYTVKEEYAKSYQYNLVLNDVDSTVTSESGTASKFLVLLNSRFLRKIAGGKPGYFSKPIYEASNPVGGNAYDVILDPCQVTVDKTSTSVDDDKDGIVDDINLWYVGPNLNIDDEMGIPWMRATGAATEAKAQYILKKQYKDKTGFDPYNIQLKNANTNEFVTTPQDSVRLENGVFVGVYTGGEGSPGLTLATNDPSKYIDGEGYDHTTLQISNHTFMAVSDENGNMQLMPRFDNTKRVNLVNNSGDSFTTLEDSKDHSEASADNNSSMGPQTVFFVRSQVFEYHIIDNSGKESLRYKRAGDYFPAITEHFRSPLATDFTYYAGLADTAYTALSNEDEWNAAEPEFRRSLTSADLLADAVNLLPYSGTYYYQISTLGSFSYKKAEVTKGLLEKQITGSFAEAGLNAGNCQVQVRYSYDVAHDGDRVLEGKWYTVKLAEKNLQATGTVVATEGATQGTGVDLFTGSKPETIDADDKVWQWKFLAAPTDPSSDYYVAPDPYDVQLFNRNANYTTNPTQQPSPMAAGIKVPNDNNGANHFALLSHDKDGGYALAVAGTGLYTYKFLNGASMTAPGAAEPATADTVVETSFTQKNGTFEGKGAQVLVNNDVQHNFEYKVINKALKAAVTATQATAEAEAHDFAPYLPDDAQTPLLNIEDYQYYGFAGRDRKETPDESDDTYSVIPQTILHTLYGLYDDTVYVTYKQYYMDSTVYRVPNKKDVVGGKVARHAESKDAALNIEGGLPYDIIWENDNMMRSNDDSETDVTGDYIKGRAGQDLQADGDNGYVWKFQGNDPYALKIYNNKQGKYIHAASADNEAACTLTAEPTEFMLLKRDGYEYGVLEMTGHPGSKLTMTDDDGSTLGVAKITTGAPKYFIIFGLSTHRLIYHLMIAKTCPDHTNPKAGEYIKIPYRTEKGVALDSLTIFGTTQRDLSDDTYQLGSTIFGQSYSYDVGEVSIGDVLQVPDTFNRPNCIFFFYVDNIQNSGDAATYQKEANDNEKYEEARDTLASIGYYYFKIGTSTYTYKRVHVTATSPSLVYTEVDCTADDWSNVWQDNDELNNQYKGLEITKLMSEAGLIGGLVKINIGYAFQTGLETNAGEGFVTSLDQNLWYTYEAKHEDGTPYLAHYTNAWGLQAMEGRETRYTNDYLWSPLGDVYGFRMYNRYMIKNSGGVKNVMTSQDISDGQNLKMAVPGEGGVPEGNEVYELLASNTPGYFRIHPVINHTGTRYYIRKDPTDNYAKLSSTSYSEWTFNLNPELLAPYIERVNYVGGLKESSYLEHKTVLDNVLNGTATYADMLNVQGIVYNDDNIVSYEPGYYRLHNQPGVSGIRPVRYVSGYLHEIEKTGDGIVATDTVPMHFYSRAGVNTTFEGEGGLGTGFTKSHATRGDIPVPSTETDPSTIFYIQGGINPADPTDAHNPRVTMQTQGLYVAANTNGDAEKGTTTGKQQRAVMSEKSSDAITFSLMDIGGAVLLIHDGAAPATRRYLNYDQSRDDSIYDLRFYHDSPTDDAKWCMQPVQKEETAKMNEMPLMVATNNGGDDYYYTTFYAPFDVLLPEDKIGTNDTTYYAYICKKWYDEGVNPTPVPAAGGHAEGKFVPAATPVIIRTNDNSDYIQLTLPSAEPTESTLTCVLSGQYLEQKMGAGNVVYSMGVPFVSTVTMDSETGDITAEIPEKDNTNVGFYINANPNKELNTKESLWLRNNRYVLHNKAYYRESAGPAQAPKHTNNTQFVPVNFGEGDEEQPEESKQIFTGLTGVYDIMGRKVASEAEAKDGSWQQRLAPGIYIVGGEKIYLGY